MYFKFVSVISFSVVVDDLINVYIHFQFCVLMFIITYPNITHPFIHGF